jgi:hypothetical protein
MTAEAFGGLTPSGLVTCNRCGRVIAYDSRSSWWLDASGIPGCAPDNEGNVLQHDPNVSQHEAHSVDEVEQFRDGLP